MTTCALVGATYFNEQDFMARYNEGFFDFIIGSALRLIWPSAISTPSATFLVRSGFPVTP